MTVGVGVEGPSDFQFWHKVLHRHFRGCRFDVRNMKNRDKLIRETPKLLETFRDCHYAAGFILVDMDDDPCISSVVGLFDEAIQRATRLQEKDARFIHVCVAIKEIESWYLADADAINAVIPGCAWAAPEDTCTVAKGRLRALVKAHLGKNTSFNEIAFAKAVAPKFNPARACRRSASLRHFWGLIESKASV
jgi:hypothetical protein